MNIRVNAGESGSRFSSVTTNPKAERKADKHSLTVALKVSLSLGDCLTYASAKIQK